MENKEFKYTYAAPTEDERREIESIRRQYEGLSANEKKIARLRRLNSIVNNSATIAALVLGVIGTLIFGLGMSMILEWDMTVFGIIISAVGLVPIAMAYPFYNIILDKYRKKYGDEIIKLSDELLNEK